MIGEFRFLKTRGETRFAKVAVRSEPADDWSVVLDPSLGGAIHRYGDPILAGIDAAMAEYRRRGGHAHEVHVESLVESTVDTTPDAVRCAAALAAWRSWGQPEAGVELVFVDGAWEVRFASE